MDLPRYFVRGRVLRADDPALQDALARIYDSAERPRCMCILGGVEMYVAKHHQFVVKRMPDTGNKHHPTCPSFEPELGTSGLGELMGEAIIEHSPESVEVRLNFPLARVPGRPFPRGEPIDTTEVHAPRRRMSLRALLHLLYERAGFNRWYQAMEGKRNQGVLHKYLNEAARDIVIKGGPLADRLYVPEPFRVENKDAIAERRRQKLAVLQSPEDDVQFKMALVVGQYNGVESTVYGRKVLVRHMPDAPLYVDGKVWEKVERAYGDLLAARDADVANKPKVLLAALIYAKREHLYQIDTLTMMLLSDQWLPLDGLYELPLIERLCQEGRSFMKPLQYDAKTSALFPNVLLFDTGEAPRPLHVIGALCEAKARAAKEKAVLSAGDAAAWVWRTEQPMPALPARAGQGLAPHLPGRSARLDRDASMSR
jgi:hypothetical protein